MHVNKTHFSLWNRQLPSLEEFSNLSWYLRLETLCWLGHMAPSSHNTQPWRFHIDADALSITCAIDTTSILPESDVAGREAMISIGCAIENINLAARAYGLSGDFYSHNVTRERISSKNEDLGLGDKIIPLVTIRFSKGDVDERELALLPNVLTRRTMRAEFDPTLLISPDFLNEIMSEISNDIVEAHVISDTMHKLTIAEFQGQADSYVLNSPRFARELGDWLLPNETDSSVGMPGNTFGFDDVQASRIYHGLRGEGVLEPEDMLRFSLGGKIGFEKSPYIIFLTSTKDDISGWIATGRAMERAFLKLESKGISYAVHAAIVEVRLINRIFAATLGTFNPLSAVFRIGYVKDASIKAERPHSPRQSMNNILINSLSA